MEEEKIKVDKDFLQQVLKSLTKLTERMDKYEQKSKEVKIVSKDNLLNKDNPSMSSGFSIECYAVYSGSKDEIIEKQFASELLALMIKFGRMEVKAILTKDSKNNDSNNSAMPF